MRYTVQSLQQLLHLLWSLLLLYAGLIIIRVYLLRETDGQQWSEWSARLVPVEAAELEGDSGVVEEVVSAVIEFTDIHFVSN